MKMQHVKTRNRPTSAASKNAARAEHEFRKRHPKQKKAVCRCCGGRKQVGREDICLKCYRKHGPGVHEIAKRRESKAAARAK